ncbi:DUF4350 domain-containing protein [Nocardioides mangrovi]|uniref:DUF4350 domain-containing protein n=1 Tax=Nocardioides mangrovi TaxID=2874580 RepID=A0ABS7UG56_9ACTN|nr:DUF4350 domain-containing protein [Nocardioides mangrovi]MBZ5739618.1 DUF4350 domain-containing protein [Nocardioides mangrovi]
MTATLTPEAPAKRGGRLRRHRSTLVVGIGLAVAVLVVLLAGGAGVRSAALDPDNPDPAGAQAVARVLEDQGVDVTVVRSADALDDTEVGADTTVLVTSTDQLGQSTLDRLVDHTRGARLVLTEPGRGPTRALGLRADPQAVTFDDAVAAGCADPSYSGLAVAVDDGVEYDVDGGCFRGGSGALLAEPRPDLWLLGAGEALSNDQVLRADNAAVALRLLGGRDRLVWYVPSLDDLVADDGVSLQTLLPSWLRPALWLAAVAVLALMVWRARRLGPLAVEPLPVVVRAIETTRSRGRLYRKAGDRAHAAAILRGAARARAADRLRLGSRPDPDTLVRDLARHTGRSVDEIAALVGPTAPAPATDHDLITLAERLAELDEEVRRP